MTSVEQFHALLLLPYPLVALLLAIYVRGLYSAISLSPSTAPSAVSAIIWTSSQVLAPHVLIFCLRWSMQVKGGAPHASINAAEWPHCPHTHASLQSAGRVAAVAGDPKQKQKLSTFEQQEALKPGPSVRLQKQVRDARGLTHCPASYLTCWHV
jgi:hypothetical protein